MTFQLVLISLQLVDMICHKAGGMPVKWISEYPIFFFYFFDGMPWNASLQFVKGTEWHLSLQAALISIPVLTCVSCGASAGIIAVYSDRSVSHFEDTDVTEMVCVWMEWQKRSHADALINPLHRVLLWSCRGPPPPSFSLANTFWRLLSSKECAFTAAKCILQAALTGFVRESSRLLVPLQVTDETRSPGL